MRPFLFFVLLLPLINSTAKAQDLTYKEIDSLLDLAYQKGDFPTTMRYAQKGVEKAKAKNQIVVESFYFQNIGLVYEKMGDYPNAELFYNKALRIREKKITPEYVTTLGNLGNLYILQNKNEMAESLLKKGLEYCKKNVGEESEIYANLLDHLANLYKTLGKYEEAEVLYKRVLKIKKQVLGTQNRSYAAALNNLGAAFYNQSKYEEAEPLYKEALEISRIVLGGEHPELAASLNNLAILYSQENKFAQAEPLLLQSLQIYKKILGDKHPTYAVFLNNLAGTYQYQNKDEAELLYKQALQIRKEVLGIEHPKYAISLNNLALFYQHKQKYDLAEPLFKEALQIRKKTLGEDNPAYAVSLNDMGGFYKSQGKYEEAKALYEKALPIFEKSSSKRDENYIQTLSDLGKLHQLTKEYDKSIFYYNTVLQLLCKSCDSSTTDWAVLPQHDYYSIKYVIMGLDGLHWTKKAQYKEFKDIKYLRESYKNLQTVMLVTEKMRHSLNDDEDKLQLLRGMSETIKSLVNTGLILAENGDKSFLQDAFGYAEQNKSILLADAVKGQKARALGDLPDSLASLEMALQTQKKELDKAETEAQNDEERHLVHKKQSDLDLKIEAFLKSIKNKFPKYHALKYESITAKVEDVQALLDEKTLMLEYFISDSTVYLFSISKKQMDLYPLSINGTLLKQKIQALRDALSNYTQIAKEPKVAYRNYIETAYWFYKELIETSLNNKKFDNLIIIADGELGHLPFETFLVERAPQADNYKVLHYLVKDYNISYNYSATLWKENLAAPKLSNNHQILACAAAYPTLDTSLLDLRAPHLFELRKQLQPLPAAQEEINVLSQKFKGDFLWNEAANEGFFKKNAHQYGIIHLAMHGILHPRVPMLSSLAFTENKDSLEDNFLQAYEIAHLHLNADLVVLSACETGYGKFEQGEGVISLARSFMYAGTPSLVVSLWQVNDHSTAVIMEAFYEHLSAGMSKDAALRQAKLDYIERSEGLAAHPAFWSAFIQLGDSRPISLGRTLGFAPAIWAIGGIIIFIPAIILFRRRKK